jgi:hypothetical protein
LAVDQYAWPGVEHQRQGKLLPFAEQHDLGPVAVGDVHHGRTGDVEHVEREPVTHLLAAHQRIMLVHGPQGAESAVARFGARHGE